MYFKVKRLIDVVLAALGLVFFLPVFIMLIVAIKLDSRGPVFFAQKRVGMCRRHFLIYKFRTMYVDTPRDVPTHLMHNPQAHITRVGRVLRQTSLDELPQLINVLKGDMSLVGPRPALWSQLDLLAERDKYGANNVPVGLTGWAQINGRDELPLEDKARLDGEYAAKIGFKMDTQCLLGTTVAVLRRDGVIEGGLGAIHKRDAASRAGEIEPSQKTPLS